MHLDAYNLDLMCVDGQAIALLYSSPYYSTSRRKMSVITSRFAKFTVPLHVVNHLLSAVCCHVGGAAVKSSRRSRQKSGGMRIVAGYLNNICDSGVLFPPP